MEVTSRFRRPATGRPTTHRTGWSRDTPEGYSCGVDQPGYVSSKDDVLKRLRRIEGQARGLQRMVEEEQYCIDILTQVSAMTKALQAVSLNLLDDHLAHCVRDAVSTGVDADEKLAEASAAIARLVRS
jgi:CsoR family transcriptional regulator, copper-sensing transcriptional repressor